MGMIFAFALFCLGIGVFMVFLQISASKFFYLGGILSILVGIIMFEEEELTKKDIVINYLLIAFGIGLIVSGFLFFREISIGVVIEVIFNKLFFWLEYFL
ncbi:MAG: hypothetical protein J6K80_01340 [Oscillospiraceae bacterium]|nr:hypothetical protein [Oscillospiraceae bacterium]